MKYSTINGYRISKLTLGTVALGMDYGISNIGGKPEKEISFEIFSTALNLGINTFDTARAYGDAEALTGSFMAEEENRNTINLITKFVIDDDNLASRDMARKQVYDSIKSSSNFLKLERVPIYLFHKRIDQQMDLILEILPGIFEDLKNDGLIDLGGVSIYHPDEVPMFLELPAIDALQVPVNVFDQRLIHNGMLQQMYLENKIVFARSIFLQGLFFIPPNDLKGNLSNARYYVQAFQDFAEQAGMSIAQLAFSYVRDLEEVTSIVFGATTELQVRENVSLLDGKKIPVHIKKSIESLFNTVPDNIITPGLWAS